MNERKILIAIATILASSTLLSIIAQKPPITSSALLIATIVATIPLIPKNNKDQ